MRTRWRLPTASLVVGTLVGLLVGVRIKSGRLADPQVWGTVAEWVAGLATAIAVAVAAIEIVGSHRRETRVQASLRRASAMAVAITDVELRETSTSFVLRATIENGGTLPIFESQIDFAHVDGWQRNVRIGTIGSGRDKRVEVAATRRTGADDVTWEVRFRDSYGDVWRSKAGAVDIIEATEMATDEP